MLSRDAVIAEVWQHFNCDSSTLLLQPSELSQHSDDDDEAGEAGETQPHMCTGYKGRRVMFRNWWRFDWLWTLFCFFPLGAMFTIKHQPESWSSAECHVFHFTRLQYNYWTVSETSHDKSKVIRFNLMQRFSTGGPGSRGGLWQDCDYWLFSAGFLLCELIQCTAAERAKFIYVKIFTTLFHPLQRHS